MHGQKLGFSRWNELFEWHASNNMHSENMPDWEILDCGQKFLKRLLAIGRRGHMPELSRQASSMEVSLADWKQENGRQTRRHAGRSYGALIPLLGITPEFIYSIAISFIYTLHMLVEFHLPISLFSFLHNYSFSFIYLQNIIPTDYIPTILFLFTWVVLSHGAISQL